MSYTVESIEVAPGPVKTISDPSQFDLPTKEFVGYDPRGTTSVTGSPLAKPDQTIAKQQTTTEQVEEAPVQEESVKLSPQISALARKEQAQRKREQALLQRERDLEVRLADAEKYSQLKAKMAAKDFSAAEELGLTNEEYVQYQLDRQAKENPEETRLRQIEERLAEREKAQEEQTVKEYELNQSLWKAEIAKIVDEDERFSTIKDLGMHDAVLRHVNDSFDEDGVELTAEQAAQEIEDELFKRAERFASVTKIKGKAAETPKVLGAPKTAPKTITQNMTVTSEKTKSSKPLHLMSEMEQWEEARRRVIAQRTQGR